VTLAKYNVWDVMYCVDKIEIRCNKDDCLLKFNFTVCKQLCQWDGELGMSI